MNELLNKAILIATSSHEGMVDKGGVNYILHPLRIMLQLKTLEEQIVAVLHDVIEDTNVTSEFLLKEGFPNYIVKAIECISRRNNESYFDFINRVKLNPLATKVKIKDLEDNSNLSRIPNPSEKDFNRVKKYTKALNILKNYSN